MSLQSHDVKMAACVSPNYEDDLQNMEVDGNISGSAPGTHSEKRMVNSLDEVSEAGKSVMLKSIINDIEDPKTCIETSTQEDTFKDKKKQLFSLGCNESQHSYSDSSQLNLETSTELIQVLPEYLSVIREMSLSSLVLGDYLVIVKSNFDMVLSGEPYLALMLLLNTGTEKYIARIWNQTVFTGTISSVDQLRAACMKHFEHMPCIGLPFTENELEEADFDFMVSHAPVLCKISNSCLNVMSKHAHSQIRSCSECQKLKGLTDPKESKLPPIGQVKNLSEPKGKGSVIHLANQALYLQEIAEKYPHVIKNGMPFKIKIKTEDSLGYLQDKVLLVDPTQTLQEGGIVETLAVMELNQTKRENLIEKTNAVEGKDESAQSEDLGKTEVSDIKDEIEDVEYGDLPVTNNSSEDAKGIKVEESIETDNVKAKKAPSGHNFLRKCSLCEKVFNKPSAYGNHMIYDHYWGSFGSFSPKEGHSNHIKRHHGDDSSKSKELFYCDQCGKQFCSKQSLKTHIWRHENRDVDCKICKQTFKSKRERDHHNILEHSLDEKYNCQYCGKRFGATDLLQKHVKHHHEREKFKCQYCEKMFNWRKTLEGHERMHRGEKPYPCSLCTQAFTTSSGLCQHLRCVHKISKQGGKVGYGHWVKNRERDREYRESRKLGVKTYAQ